MGIEYLGLSSIKGPLVILKEYRRHFTRSSNLRLMEKRKIGRIIELYEDKSSDSGILRERKYVLKNKIN